MLLYLSASSFHDGCNFLQWPHLDTTVVQIQSVYNERYIYFLLLHIFRLQQFANKPHCSKEMWNYMYYGHVMKDDIKVQRGASEALHWEILRGSYMVAFFCTLRSPHVPLKVRGPPFWDRWHVTWAAVNQWAPRKHRFPNYNRLFLHELLISAVPQTECTCLSFPVQRALKVCNHLSTASKVPVRALGSTEAFMKSTPMPVKCS